MQIQYHKELAEWKWNKMTLANQLGNAWSEFSRAISSKVNNQERMQLALERWLELIDMTIADPKLTSSWRKELCRLREAICDHFYGEDMYGITDEYINKYFLDFALAARR